MRKLFLKHLYDSRSLSPASSAHIRACAQLCAEGNAYGRAPPSLVMRDANQVRAQREVDQ
jgi:hypothetical protein